MHSSCSGTHTNRTLGTVISLQGVVIAVNWPESILEYDVVQWTSPKKVATHVSYFKELKQTGRVGAIHT